MNLGDCQGALTECRRTFTSHWGWASFPCFRSLRQLRFKRSCSFTTAHLAEPRKQNRFLHRLACCDDAHARTLEMQNMKTLSNDMLRKSHPFHKTHPGHLHLQYLLRGILDSEQRQWAMSAINHECEAGKALGPLFLVAQSSPFWM